MPPDAAFGPAIPAKSTQKTTGKVTRAASAVLEFTAVPMTRSTLPTTPRVRWATKMLRRVPQNLACTSAEKALQRIYIARCQPRLRWLDILSTWSAQLQHVLTIKPTENTMRNSKS